MYFWAITGNELVRYVVLAGMLAFGNLLVLKSFQILLSEELDAPDVFELLA